MNPRIAAKAASAARTIPAMPPPDILFFFAFVFEVLFGWVLPEEFEAEELAFEDELFVFVDVEDFVGQPSTGLFFAHPSIGCAYPWAPVVLGAHISWCAEPVESYTTAVNFSDRGISV
jgi:hypothetical protein